MKTLWTLLCYFIGFSHSIYEDEIGVNDWLKLHIGPPQSLHLTKNSKYLTHTSSAVIASLEPLTGEIIWRQVLDEKDPILCSKVLKNGQFLTVGFETLRLWDSDDGDLLWHVKTRETRRGKGKQDFENFCSITSQKNEHSLVLVSYFDRILQIDSSNGKIKWSFEVGELKSQLSDKKVVLTDVKITSENLLSATGIAGSDSKTPLYWIAAIKVGEKNELIECFTDNLESDLMLPKFVKSDGSNGEWFVVTSKGGKTLFLTNALSKLSKEISIECKPLSIDNSNSMGLLLEIQCTGSSMVFLLDENESTRAVLECSEKDCQVSTFFSKEGEVFASKLVRKEGRLAQYETKRIATDGHKHEIPPIRFEYPFELHGSFNKIFPIVYSVGSLVVSNAVVTSEDDSIVSIQGEGRNKAIDFIREEGLSNLTFVDMVEYSMDASPINHLPNFYERLSLHAQDFRYFCGYGVSLLLGLKMNENRIYDPDSEFGLKKLIIAASEKGKIFAIDSISGEIVWTMFDRSRSIKTTMYITRPNTVLNQLPEFFVFEDKVGDGRQLMRYFNAMTGQESFGPFEFTDKVDRIFPIGLHDATGRQILVAVKENESVVLLPPTEDVYLRAEAILQSLYHHKITGDGLSTYLVMPEGKSEGGDEGGSEGWRVPKLKSLRMGFVSLKGEDIVAKTYPLPHEVVQSPAVVLGDDSLLLKYLNPHMVVVGTLKREESMEGNVKNVVGRLLTIWMIDTVSGKVLYREQHEGASEPVHCEISEYNVVCTYWSSLAKRTELSSISLYEGMIGRYGLGPSKQPERNLQFSSFDSLPPVAIQKTYVFPYSVSALGLPLTSHGITSKSLYMAIEGGHIFSLDRKWVDPRRPLNEPTKIEKEEKLLQYQPIIPVHRLNVLSYGNEVARTREIVTSPAKLESISVLLAAGLDLFCTRATPSKTFDLLAPTFNYSMLLTVIAGLVAVNIVARSASRRKTLNALWA